MRERILKIKSNIYTRLQTQPNLLLDDMVYYGYNFFIDSDKNVNRVIMDSCEKLYTSKIDTTKDKNIYFLSVREFGDIYGGKDVCTIWFDGFFESNKYPTNHEGFVYIDKIVTDKDYQGQGIAGLALCQVLDFCLENLKNEKIVLCASGGCYDFSDMERNCPIEKKVSFQTKHLHDLIRFYQKHGFSISKEDIDSKTLCKNMLFNKQNRRIFSKQVEIGGVRVYVNQSSKENNKKFFIDAEK